MPLSLLFSQSALLFFFCSGFYGVEFCDASHKWVAYVDIPDQKHIIGRYDSKETAALQYNAVADRLEGAHLNVVEEKELAPSVMLSSSGGVKATSKVSSVNIFSIQIKFFFKLTIAQMQKQM